MLVVLLLAVIVIHRFNKNAAYALLFVMCNMTIALGLYGINQLLTYVIHLP